MRSSLLMLALLVAAPPVPAVEAGAPAPAFSGKPLAGGEPVALEALRGKVVYLDFWASWCGPCRLSLPWMEQLRKDFGAAGLEVVAVNVDETPADGIAFLKRLPVSYPVVGDAGGDIAELYDVRDMPSSYLIDRDGTVRLVHRGFNTRAAAKLRGRIAELVGAAP